MNEKILENLGLTKNEARVYLATLRAGSASTGSIAKESGLHRRNAYDATERLVKKGLLGHMLKGKVKHFQITSLEKLLDFAKEQRAKAKANEDMLRSLISELTLAGLSRDRQAVSILEGRESRRLVFEDILKSAKENLCLGGHTPSKLSIRYVRQWHRRRVLAGIRDMIIYNRKDPFSRYLKNLKHTEVRLAAEPINSKTVINIYGNKVAIFLWINDRPLTILMENEKVASDFKEYFDFIWKRSQEA